MALAKIVYASMTSTEEIADIVAKNWKRIGSL